jgi:hypothetical protein
MPAYANVDELRAFTHSADPTDLMGAVAAGHP